MNFTQAISSGFNNYVNFAGRAARSEFWYWALFAALASLAGELIDLALFTSSTFTPVQTLVNLALFLPGLAVVAKLAQPSDTVLLVSTDAFFFSRHTQIAMLAARHALPAMFDNREYAVAGGLVSYGADFLNVMQLSGGYTGRILKGEKPSDLPVMPQNTSL
jgi:hypothetical protein